MTEAKSNDNPDVVQQVSGEDQLDVQNLITKAAGNILNKSSKEESKPEETEETEAVEDTESTDNVGDTEETKTEEVNEEETSGEETEDTDVLSQIDFDALSDDDKQEIAKRVGSGAGKEIGKLRKELAEAKKQSEALQSQLEEGFAPADDNQYAKVKDVAKLDDTEKQINQALEYYQGRALSGDWDVNNEGDEGIFDGQGKFWTKDAVKQGVLAMQKQTRDIALQRQRIRDLGDIERYESNEFEKTKEELAWLQEEDSEQFKEFKKLTEDSELKHLERVAPKWGKRLKRILAHYVNSVSAPKPTGKLNLPLKQAKKIGSASNAASANPNGNKRRGKAMEKINSGDYGDDDLAAMMFGR